MALDPDRTARAATDDTPKPTRLAAARAAQKPTPWVWWIGGAILAALVVFFLIGLREDDTHSVQNDPSSTPRAATSANPGASVAPSAIPPQQAPASNR